MITNLYIPVEKDFSKLVSNTLLSDGEDITLSIADKQVEKGRMFILKFNINPDIENMDAEDELRWWIGESSKILSDNKIDMKTKLNILPRKDFKIEVEENMFLLHDVQVIENKSDKKVIYNISTLVNRIENE